MKKSILTKWLALLLAGVTALSLMSCGQSISCSVMRSQDLMEGITKSANIESGDLTLEEYNHENTMEFTVRLLQNSVSKEKNTLVSPVSVLAALAMLANGTKGETLEQIEAVLCASIEDLNREMGLYITNCNAKTNKQLSIANAIWFTENESFSVNPAFLQMNADHYEADIYAAPFDDSTVVDINWWVNQNTNGMIEQLLSDIPSDTMMYLINAVAFEAKWQTKYSTKDVKDGIFTNVDGVQQNVEFMHSEENIYIETENATGFMKYYEGNDYAFVAILPEEGMTLEEYIASLSGKELYDMVTYPEETSVDAAIPKFEITDSMELSEILSNMGMPLAFAQDTADFTGIGSSTQGNLYINRMLHKTYISVDEEGTKAAAITSGELVCESESKTVCLNRPFIYIILETSTCKPLFVGTVKTW